MSDQARTDRRRAAVRALMGIGGWTVTETAEFLGIGEAVVRLDAVSLGIRFPTPLPPDVASLDAYRRRSGVPAIR